MDDRRVSKLRIITRMMHGIHLQQPTLLCSRSNDQLYIYIYIHMQFCNASLSCLCLHTDIIILYLNELVTVAWLQLPGYSCLVTVVCCV